MESENARDGKPISIPSAYTLNSEGQAVLQILEFVPREREFDSLRGKAWVHISWVYSEKHSPEFGLIHQGSDVKGRRVVTSSGKPENVTVLAIVNVFWPMAGAHIKVKIPLETFVEALVCFNDGRFALATTSWGNLTPSQREKILQNRPVCPVCKKVRFDATRGVNACGKCLTLNDHFNVVGPFFRGLDPTVTVSTSEIGESLLFRFENETVSHRFRKGYGFDWIEDKKALKAGKGRMEKVWDLLRPVPAETIAEASTILDLFGITLQVNPAEPREVFVQGAWIESLKPRTRKGLGLKGKKNAYFVHGVQALNELVELMLGALRGDKCPFDLLPETSDGKSYEIPARPSNWKNNWWKL